MNMLREMPRRSFLKSLVAIAGVPYAIVFLGRVAALAQEKLQLIDMTMKTRTDDSNKQAVNIAKNFAYVNDANKDKREGAQTLKGPGGKDIPPAQQFCGKAGSAPQCRYYVETEKGKMGKCQLIPVPGNAVNHVGWCNMWAPLG